MSRLIFGPLRSNSVRRIKNFNIIRFKLHTWVKLSCFCPSYISASNFWSIWVVASTAFRYTLSSIILCFSAQQSCSPATYQALVIHDRLRLDIVSPPSYFATVNLRPIGFSSTVTATFWYRVPPYLSPVIFIDTRVGQDPSFTNISAYQLLCHDIQLTHFFWVTWPFSFLTL